MADYVLWRDHFKGQVSGLVKELIYKNKGKVDDFIDHIDKQINTVSILATGSPNNKMKIFYQAHAAQLNALKTVLEEQRVIVKEELL